MGYAALETRSTPVASRQTRAAGLACARSVGLACASDALAKRKAVGVLEPSLPQPRGGAMLATTLAPVALTPGEAGGHKGEMAAHDEPMLVATLPPVALTPRVGWRAAIDEFELPQEGAAAAAAACKLREAAAGAGAAAVAGPPVAAGVEAEVAAGISSGMSRGADVAAVASLRCLGGAGAAPRAGNTNAWATIGTLAFTIVVAPPRPVGTLGPVGGCAGAGITIGCLIMTGTWLPATLIVPMMLPAGAKEGHACVGQPNRPCGRYPATSGERLWARGRVAASDEPSRRRGLGRSHLPACQSGWAAAQPAAAHWSEMVPFAACEVPGAARKGRRR